ncbi:hypothetical protein VNI00_004540 [Paramarasmius palmivorus]|uniref:LysM domain-containing protein n=1 Tax=Paramarasmius palmivorus TaxID=297713 RepID=A0AAW0DKT4_9AGAR
MGRWTQYDEDSYRLPEGMKRVGYDSDTQKYFFRDRDGTLWEGPEGAEFGEMKRVADSDSSRFQREENDDIEALPTRSDGYGPLATDPNHSVSYRKDSAYRTLFPFFLLIAVVMLLLWRVLFQSSGPAPPACPKNASVYRVQPGDTCWQISKDNGIPLDRLMGMNEKVNCDKLMPGCVMCLPKEEGASS